MSLVKKVPKLSRQCAPGTAVSDALDLLLCENVVSFLVAVRRGLDDFFRQGGRRGLLVPGLFFQPVTQVLLVKAGLALAGLVLVGRPEARRIGREHLINKIGQSSLWQRCEGYVFTLKFFYQLFICHFIVPDMRYRF